jgi:membrane protein CcdC involved in cytochrome C biogenesis
MQSLMQILPHTPARVYVLLVYLVSRGMKALKPAEVTPLKLVLVPALLTGWGLSDLVRLYGVSVASLLPWLGAIGVGAVVGWFLVKASFVEVDRANGVIRRPADYTVLPLILIAFSIKYTFGVLAAIAPERLADPYFRVMDLTLAGAFAGIFVGKLAHYLTRYFDETETASGYCKPTATLPAQDRGL